MPADAQQRAWLDVVAILFGQHAVHLVLGEIALPELLDAGDEAIIVQRGAASDWQVPGAKLGLVLAFARAKGEGGC